MGKGTKNYLYKRKKEHHPLLNPRKALLTLPLHLGSPYWLPTLLQLLFLNF